MDRYRHRYTDLYTYISIRYRYTRTVICPSIDSRLCSAEGPKCSKSCNVRSVAPAHWCAWLGETRGGRAGSLCKPSNPE